MLTDKEKKNLEKKIKGINSTNQKITIMLLDKLKSDLKSKDSIKNDIKSKISKCDGEIFYLYNIASDMWYLAGDKSTDYNFYTKRLILTGILSKLYFKILTLKDYSLEQLEIDIKGEIKNVGKFNKLKSKIISTFQNLKDRPFSKNTGRGY
jgi:ubiquinone biosynthesis protein COQ9